MGCNPLAHYSLDEGMFSRGNHMLKPLYGDAGKTGGGMWPVWILACAQLRWLLVEIASRAFIDALI